MMNPYLDIC